MKTLLNKIIKEDNFLSLSGNAIIAVLGVGGFALLARTLSMDQFGQWVLFISAASFVEMFRFGITGNGLIRFLAGASSSDRLSLIGSNAFIGLIVTSIFALIVASCNLIFYNPISQSGFHLFFTWYPLLAFLNLPWNNAMAVLQADMQYGKILRLKALNSGLFFAVLLVNYFELSLSLTELVLALLITNTLTSMLSLIKGWDGMRNIGRFSKKANMTLLDFGKYTTFTLIGTNLLRNADTFIISLSPLGSTAVALYSIPLKLTELQQIPLRSFVATAFPKMSKASMAGKVTKVRDLFYTYSGALSFLFIIMSLVTFIFADLLVFILSGSQYLTNDPVTGFNAVDIVRVFAIYGLLLPIDRMTGIGLDSINKPNINALKVLVMVLANIIGDIVAIFVFKSLMMVAVASIVFTLLGIWLGMYFLNRELTLTYREIFINGIRFYQTLWRGHRNKVFNGITKPIEE